MPYQDRHPGDGGGGEQVPSPVPHSAPVRENEPANARSIVIIIVIGFIAAIAVAVFGKY